MEFRARLRRAFPYFVIGIGGFALAYVIVYVFVLPTKIVPPLPHPRAADTLPTALQPIDTAALPAVVEPPPMSERVQTAPPPDLQPLQVPDLVGMALPDARAMLNGMHLRATVVRDTSSFQPPGTILRQSPAPGTSIPINGTITLTESYFPPDSSVGTMPGQGARAIQRGRSLPPIIPADSEAARRRKPDPAAPLRPPDSTAHPQALHASRSHRPINSER